MGLKKEVTTIGKHSVIYGLGGVLSKLVGFIMIPIYTRALRDVGYGALSLLSITTNLLATVISVGIANAMFRFYYDYQEEQDRHEVISTAVISFTAIALCVVGVLSMFTRQFSVLILKSSDYSLHFLVSFASIWFSTLVQMGQDYLRIKERSAVYLIISVTRLIAALSLNIYFIVILKLGVMGVLLSTLITGAAFSAILLVPVLLRTGLRFSIDKFKKMVRFGAPLIFSNVARTIINRSDRFFLARLDSLAATGVYDLGYRFGTLVHEFVATAFMMIWFPRRMATYREENAEKTFARVFTYFVLLSAFVGLGISVMIKDVIMIMATEQFWQAHTIVPAVILCYIVFGFHIHFSVGILIAKKTKYIALVDTTNAVLNLILNFFLIQRYQAWGAVAATFICFSFRSAATYYFSSRVRPIHFEKLRILQLIACAAVLYYASILVDLGSVWLNLPVKTMFALAYPVVLLLTGFFDRDEIMQMRRTWTWAWARVTQGA